MNQKNTKKKKIVTKLQRALAVEKRRLIGRRNERRWMKQYLKLEDSEWQPRIASIEFGCTVAPDCIILSVLGLSLKREIFLENISSAPKDWVLPKLHLNPTSAT